MIIKLIKLHQGSIIIKWDELNKAAYYEKKLTCNDEMENHFKNCLYLDSKKQLRAVLNADSSIVATDMQISEIELKYEKDKKSGEVSYKFSGIKFIFVEHISSCYVTKEFFFENPEQFIQYKNKLANLAVGYIQGDRNINPELPFMKTA